MAESDRRPQFSPRLSPLLRRSDLSQADRVRLLTELASPYRSLRRFIYLAVGSSATIGAFVFFFRALAGRELSVTLPSLALQLGILAAMLGLNHWEGRARKRLVGRVEQRLGINPSQSSAPLVSSEPDEPEC
ncbi:DUF3493 domain-containing protein [Thermostichus vulcanus]|uniref:DUF3493 domain-containing protein n=1 Tax=Thermostichus vulcanus str. 'Rupite' TaxID=2813851 RepID=A0ABT0C7J6_THEVL|nr:DUF3493 domain-containing protein [Thermostichus vulcanus]MCJ2541764.1 DUF3493 domain-containing protein [Thermostichus vulcanus str. 'Rupite']